jgi:hypothetical protein
MDWFSGGKTAVFDAKLLDPAGLGLISQAFPVFPFELIFS